MSLSEDQKVTETSTGDFQTPLLSQQACVTIHLSFSVSRATVYSLQLALLFLRCAHLPPLGPFLPSGIAGKRLDKAPLYPSVDVFSLSLITATKGSITPLGLALWVMTKSTMLLMGQHTKGVGQSWAASIWKNSPGGFL